MVDRIIHIPVKTNVRKEDWDRASKIIEGSMLKMGYMVEWVPDTEENRALFKDEMKLREERYGS